jgi:hypothetical protein
MTTVNSQMGSQDVRPFLDAAARAAVVAACTKHGSSGFSPKGQAKVAASSIHGETADSARARLDGSRLELAAFDKAREDERRARAEAEAAKRAAEASPAPAAPDSDPAATDAASPRRGLLARVRGWFRRKPVSPAPDPVEPPASSVSRGELVQRIASLEARVGELAAIEAEYAEVFEAEFQNHWARVACLPIYDAGATLAGGL